LPARYKGHIDNNQLSGETIGPKTAAMALPGHFSSVKGVHSLRKGGDFLTKTTQKLANAYMFFPT
jgi:hypothetical protein